MNLTQELTNARTYFQKGIECLNNVENVFGIHTATPGVTTIGRKGTLTLAGRRKISAAQKRRHAAAQANPGNGNRIAV